MCPSPESPGQSGGLSIPGAIDSVNGDIIGGDKFQFGFDEQEIGRQLRPVNERLAALTAEIARSKGVEIAPLRAILAKLGEAGVPDYEIPARLDAAADELIKLRTQLARLTNDRPEFASIRNQALAHLDRGEFDAARAALARGRGAARKLRGNMSLNEAEFLADEARIDHLQFAYRAAAERYAEAAALVMSFDHEAGWQYLVDQANELFNHGQEFGEKQALLAGCGKSRPIGPDIGL
jgi:hypothetical protein